MPHVMTLEQVAAIPCKVSRGLFSYSCRLVGCWEYLPGDSDEPTDLGARYYIEQYSADRFAVVYNQTTLCEYRTAEEAIVGLCHYTGDYYAMR